MEQDANNHEATLREYVRIVFKHQHIIVTTFIVTVLSAIIGLQFFVPTYKAEAKMMVAAEKQTDSYYREATQVAITQSEIVKSLAVLERVVLALGLDKRPKPENKPWVSALMTLVSDAGTSLGLWGEPQQEVSNQKPAVIRLNKVVQELKNNIEVRIVRDTGMFLIQVSDSDPVMAARIANVVSRSYVVFYLEQQLVELQSKFGDKHPVVSQLKNNIDDMVSNLTGKILPNVEALGNANVKIIEQASVPLRPSGLSEKLTLLIAFLMSIAIGLVLAFAFEYSDQTIRGPGDVEQVLNIPYIASIRRKRPGEQAAVNFKITLTEYGRSWEDVCDHIHLLLKDKGIASLMVASTLKAEDSAGAVANIANYMGQLLKSRVLLVDADLRAPVLHSLVKIPNNRGLADYLSGKEELMSLVCKIDDNISVLPAGRTSLNPVILFKSNKLEAFIKKAGENFDIVIILSASMRNHKDPALLAEHTDGLLLVIDEGKVRRQIIREAFGAVRGKAKNVLGAVLINRTYPIPGWLYERV